MNETLSRDILGVYTAFEQTDYGQVLAQNVRYEKYNLAQISNPEWVRLLGADVNNLTHMPLTRGLTKSFIKATNEHQPGYFDDDEAALLELAAIIHDQGEAIVGDISYGDKTAEDESEEQQQFVNNLDAFCPGASDEMKAMIIRARDEIVFSQATKLGRAFNVIERTGYVRTALRANDHLMKGTAGVSAEGLEWILADVLSNQPMKLMQYAEEYPAVWGYLLAQREQISVAFQVVTDAVFENYGANADAKRAQFEEAYQAWSIWNQAQHSEPL